MSAEFVFGPGEDSNSVHSALLSSLDRPFVTREDLGIYNSADLFESEVTYRSDGNGNEGMIEEQTPVTTRGLVEEFLDWNETGCTPTYTATVPDPVTGDLKQMVYSAGSANRFAPNYRKEKYRELMNMARAMGAEYGKLLHTAMISLTASWSPDSEGGVQVAHGDHVDELLASWPSVRRALSRVTEDYRSERIAVLEPQKQGYAHIHIGVFVQGRVTEADFEPVVDAHLRNCAYAEFEAHNYHHPDSEERPITVYNTGTSRKHEPEDLGAYLAAYMGDSFIEGEDESFEDMSYTEGRSQDMEVVPAHVKVFWAVMWATGTQQFRPSNGAREMMREFDERVKARLMADGATLGDVVTYFTSRGYDRGVVLGHLGYHLNRHIWVRRFARWRDDHVSFGVERDAEEFVGELSTDYVEKEQVMAWYSSDVLMDDIEWNWYGVADADLPSRLVVEGDGSYNVREDKDETPLDAMFRELLRPLCAHERGACDCETEEVRTGSSWEFDEDEGRHVLVEETEERLDESCGCFDEHGWFCECEDATIQQCKSPSGGRRKMTLAERNEEAEERWAQQVRRARRVQTRRRGRA